MDDLVPLLIFLFIAGVNIVKFILEKGVKGKSVPDPDSGEAPRRKPGSIEEFFEQLAEKLEPAPPAQPDWPEPLAESPGMEPVAAAPVEAVEVPPPEPVPRPKPEPPKIPVPDQERSLQSALRAVPSSVAGMRAMRIRTAPMLRSGGGRIDFPLRNQTDLRRAVIAHIIFSPPRAFDAEFKNTIAE